jgi:two-component system CheB/CheR fusion protein
MARSTKKAVKAGKKRVAPAPAPESPGVPSILVGIGASAGGIKSLLELLGALPVGTSMSVLVMLHLDPAKPSSLVSILARKCPLPVREISSGLRIAPGHVYVAPPAQDVLLSREAFSLVLREKRAALDGAIDKLFLSLAEAWRDKAVAVILSGTGSDGTRGIEAVKAGGGVTFVEAHSSAQCYGMPGSALNTGAIDYSLTPKAIARKLIRHSRSPLSPPPPTPAKTHAEIDASGLQSVFAALKSARRIDFTEYKPNTLRRRVGRRMALRRVPRITDYADLLLHDPQELDQLLRDLLINVTGFFRDKPVFEALSKEVLPKIVAAKAKGDPLRIWVPGCATGEEVYSLAICVSEVLAKMDKQLTVQIFATDLSDWAITTARAGVFSEAALKNVSTARRRAFFDRRGENFHIRRAIRDMCTFAQQNLGADPPFSRLDLVSCRNVLIYLGSTLQRRCVGLFYYALNPGGYLLLGVSETIGNFPELFALADKKNKIYQKKSGPMPSRKLPRELSLTGPKLAPVPTVKTVSKAELARQDAAHEVQSMADQLILTHFAPCGVVVDSRMQVCHFRGRTAPFLEHASGAASLSLLKMLRYPLAADVTAAVQHALKTGSGVRKECIVPSKESAIGISLEVIPFTVGAAPEQWLLIMFEQLPLATALPVPLPGEGEAALYAREVERLRQELNATKDSLQSIIEEQEAANEEIRCANEEIESSNEELQSTNEELETAKEELQSTNEELSTVNEELHQRNQEVGEINMALNNLLGSINIAVVVADSRLTIRRTTPLAEKLFNILPTDIGRRLSDINPNVEMPMLPKMIRSVLDDLTPLEQRVRDSENRQYSLRVRPYRTRENVVEGVVILLVDLDYPAKESPDFDSRG